MVKQRWIYDDLKDLGYNASSTDTGYFFSKDGIIHISLGWLPENWCQVTVYSLDYQEHICKWVRQNLDSVLKFIEKATQVLASWDDVVVNPPRTMQQEQGQENE